MTDHSDLKAKAEAATMGPWFAANARYIAAASPDVVLALIAENEMLTAVLAEVRDIAAQNVAANERLRATLQTIFDGPQGPSGGLHPSAWCQRQAAQALAIRTCQPEMISATGATDAD